MIDTAPAIARPRPTDARAIAGPARGASPALAPATCGCVGRVPPRLDRRPTARRRAPAAARRVRPALALLVGRGGRRAAPRRRARRRRGRAGAQLLAAPRRHHGRRPRAPAPPDRVGASSASATAILAGDALLDARLEVLLEAPARRPRGRRAALADARPRELIARPGRRPGLRAARRRHARRVPGDGGATRPAPCSACARRDRRRARRRAAGRGRRRWRAFGAELGLAFQARRRPARHLGRPRRSPASRSAPTCARARRSLPVACADGRAAAPGRRAARAWLDRSGELDDDDAAARAPSSSSAAGGRDWADRRGRRARIGRGRRRRCAGADLDAGAPRPSSCARPLRRASGSR